MPLLRLRCADAAARRAREVWERLSLGLCSSGEELVKRLLVFFVSTAVVTLAVSSTATAATAARVTVGSPSGLTPRNHQNEPAVAIDAHDPSVLVAGTNDFIDQQPCPRTLALTTGSCLPNPRPNVGVSGVYFSFDSGHSWVQPTYTGWSARDCDPTDGACSGHVGPIGTVPWYYEVGLVSFGDPAVAVGPRPAPGGFSWANGSRVYYANLAAKFGSVLVKSPGGEIRGLSGAAVSRLDDPTPARVQQKSNWFRPVLVAPRSGSQTLEDKEQVWADNAATSPFFGNAYVCIHVFQPRATTSLVVSRSTDGGSSWTEKTIPGTQANNVRQGFPGSGCTIRTDSHGIVYVFYTRFAAGTPGMGTHQFVKSYDGGVHWTRPQTAVHMNDMCFNVDPIEQRCVMDGYAGARIDLSAAPSVDIANGAPTGTDATNLIVDAWSDGRAGLNHEMTLVSWSSNGGDSWHSPVAASGPGDRSMYSAPAIAPDGSVVYVVYEGPTAPWRGADMTSPRPSHGVFRSASVASGLSTWSTLYDGPLGDLRGTYPGHDIYQERVGDYVYAAATQTYGASVWTDARDASVCDPVQDYRARSLAAGQLALPAPWPLADCPATFGNTDTWSATTG
jgi:hypothetical protein